MAVRPTVARRLPLAALIAMLLVGAFFLIARGPARLTLVSSYQVPVARPDPTFDLPNRVVTLVDAPGVTWRVSLDTGATHVGPRMPAPADCRLAFAGIADGARAAYAGGPQPLVVVTQRGRARDTWRTGQQLLPTVFSGDGRWLAAVDEGRRVCVLDAATRSVQTLEGPPPDGVFAAAFSQSGRRLAVSDSRQRVQVWDLPSGRQVLDRNAPRRVEHLAIAPDGSAVIAGLKGAGVTEWNLAAASRRAPLAGAEAPIHVECLAYSTDGRMLAYGAMHRVEVWRRRPERQIAYADLGDAWPVAVAIDSRRHELIALDNTGWLKRWRLP